VGTDPLGYLAFVLHHLSRDHYDLLLPVHEQAFLFAKVRIDCPMAYILLSPRLTPSCRCRERWRSRA
jgi:hypothetical protein